MKHRLAMVTVVVPDYDVGIDFFVGKLGFRLVTDTALEDGKRWVVVEAGGGRMLLARAANDAQAGAIGRQTGGRVGFFLETDDFAASHAGLREAGVPFEQAPRREAYGIVAVFRDPFGNRWDLLEAAPATRQEVA